MFQKILSYFRLPYVRNKNIASIYYIYFATSAWFTLGIWYTFFLGVASAEQIALVHTLGFVAGIGLDIPTGYLADKYGRKRLLTIGLLLFSIGAGSFAFITSVWNMILCEIIVQIGLACISGSQEAVLHNTISAIKHASEDADELFSIIYAKCRMIIDLAVIICGFTGGFMYELNVKSPWLAMAGLCFIAFLLSATLHDHQEYTDESDEPGVLLHIKDSVKIFSSGKYSFLLLAVIALGGIAFISDWGVFPIGSLEQVGYEPLQISMFFTITYIITLFLANTVPYLYKRLGTVRGFIVYGFVVAVLMGVGCISLIVSPKLLAIPLAAFIAVSSLFLSYITSVVSKVSNEKNRATALSMSSLLQKLAYMVCAPFVGYGFAKRQPLYIFAAFGFIILAYTLYLASRKHRIIQSIS